MIDFRYFLVSIVAIFFALAIGIVLGSGPLEGNINQVINSTNEQLAQEKKDLQSQVVDLQDAVGASQEYAGTTAPLTLEGQLSGQSVALVVLTGASDDQVDDVSTALEQAGARIGSTVRLSDAWVDPDQQEVLGRVAAGLDRASGDSNASVAAGDVLADALVASTPTGVAPGDPSKIDPQGIAVVSGLAEAGFVQVSEPTAIRRSGLAVVVSPVATADASVTARFLPLISALEKDGKGVVVAGSVESTEVGGTIAEVRGSDLADDVSTVDDLDLTMGSPTVALALVEQLRDGAGQYGIHSGATAVVPDVTKK